MAATMEAAIFIMFNMHACVCAHVCMYMHEHAPTPPPKDLESVKNSPPMGGCFFGGWMGGLVGQNM